MEASTKTYWDLGGKYLSFLAPGDYIDRSRKIHKAQPHLIASVPHGLTSFSCLTFHSYSGACWDHSAPKFLPSNSCHEFQRKTNLCQDPSTNRVPSHDCGQSSCCLLSCLQSMKTELRNLPEVVSEWILNVSCGEKKMVNNDKEPLSLISPLRYWVRDSWRNDPYPWLIALLHKCEVG